MWMVSWAAFWSSSRMSSRWSALPPKQRGLAVAAPAFPAHVRRLDACGEHHVQDGLVRRHVQGPAVAGQHDFKRLVAGSPGVRAKSGVNRGSRRRGGEQLHVDGARRPVRRGGARRVDQPARPAYVGVGTIRAVAQGDGQIQAAAGVTLVVVQQQAWAVRFQQLGMVGRVGGGAGAVDDPERRPDGLQAMGHGPYRRDAHAAGHQDVLRRVFPQWERIARPGDLQPVADRHAAVQLP